MADTKQHLEELAQFIRGNRSAESHFESIYEKAKTEYAAVRESSDPNQEAYAAKLQQCLENVADVYWKNKEKGISTWSEFENFVTHFEKAVSEALANA